MSQEPCGDSAHRTRHTALACETLPCFCPVQRRTCSRAARHHRSLWPTLIAMALSARALVLAASVLACSQPVGDTTLMADVSTGLMSTTAADPTTGEPTTGTSVPGLMTTTVDVTGTATTEVADGTTGSSTTAADTTSDDTTSSTGEPVCSDFSCSPEFDQVFCGGTLIQSCAAGTFCVDDGCKPLTPCEAAALLRRSDGCDF